MGAVFTRVRFSARFRPSATGRNCFASSGSRLAITITRSSAAPCVRLTFDAQSQSAWSDADVIRISQYRPMMRSSASREVPHRIEFQCIGR